MKHELAKITLIRVGYKVTGGKDGLKMETKWDLIKSDLMKLEAFKHMSFKEGPAGSMSLQNQFNRFQVAVLTKYGSSNKFSICKYSIKATSLTNRFTFLL